MSKYHAGTIVVAEMPGPCPIHKVGDVIAFRGEGTGGLLEGRMCLAAVESCLGTASNMCYSGEPSGPVRIGCPDNGNVLFELKRA